MFVSLEVQLTQNLGFVDTEPCGSVATASLMRRPN